MKKGHHPPKVIKSKLMPLILGIGVGMVITLLVINLAPKGFNLPKFFTKTQLTTQSTPALTPPTHTVDIEQALKDNPKLVDCINITTGPLEQCVDDYLAKITEAKGIRAALDIIEAASQKYPQLLTWSHPFVHTIGQHSLKYYEKFKDLPFESQISRGLIECDGFGSFGCYHGVIEVGLGKLPVEKRSSIIRKACIEDPEVTKKPYYVQQCAHWFGHGVALFTDNTLLEALAMCEGLDPNWGSGAVQLCLSGVFHSGLAPGETDEEHLVNIKNVFKEGDPYYPCLDIPEKFRGHCYSHAYGRARNADIGVQLKTCDNIPEPDSRKKRVYAGGCYDSVGNNVIEMSNFDPQKAVETCKQYASPNLRMYCYGGAARYWVLRNPLLENTKPLELCSKAEKENKPHCYARAGFGNFENFASKDILNQFCSKAEAEYWEFCLRRTVPDDFTGGYVKR